MIRDLEQRMQDSKNMSSASDKKLPSVAVVGCGYWGKNHIRNFYQLGALKLVCDKDESLLAQTKNLYSGVEICFALTDVLSREDINGIVIATPAETHYHFARESLLAGKHVLVEKPLVFHVEEARELIELADKKNRILMVGHLLQYHPGFVRLKEFVKTGELGRINYIYSHRLNLGKIRREENILWSFAPHDISMILRLAGEEPEVVLSTGGYYLHSKIADVTTTHLEFPSGLKAHIFVSWLHPFKEQKLVVVGDRKMAVFDDTKPWSEKLLLYPHSIEWQDQVPVSSKSEADRVCLSEAEPLRTECEQFLQCICDGRQPITSGQEGLRVLRILNACQKSLDNNGSKIFMKTNKGFDPLFSQPTSSDCFVHPTAVVDDGVSIGSGTKIWFFSHVLTGSTVGEKCNIGQNVVIGPDVLIGNRCKIQNNVSIFKGVTLEDGVFCGPSVVFTNVYNPRAELSKMNQMRPTLVKRGATLGANCTIVCGVILGCYSFIGAGAVVTEDVPDYALVVGNPAKQIGWVCECGERLSDTLTCTACSKRYESAGSGLMCIV